jgi:ribosomal protein L40E
MRCKNCGAQLEKGTNFCEVCGTRVEIATPQQIRVMANRFCPDCGAKADMDAKFCRECGAHLGPITRKPVIEDHQPKTISELPKHLTAAEKNSSLILTPAGGLIALICFFLPWLEMDCGFWKITASGLDLASRSGSYGSASLILMLMWLIPICAIVIVISYFMKSSNPNLKVKSLVMLASIIPTILISILITHLTQRVEQG